MIKLFGVEVINQMVYDLIASYAVNTVRPCRLPVCCCTPLVVVGLPMWFKLMCGVVSAINYPVAPATIAFGSFIATVTGAGY